jgi:3-oxoacyl-[acyl-carrier protein] reductase
MQLFDDETAIVTGAGNGIGRAIALALVREGVPTIFADVKTDTVESAVGEATAAAQAAVKAGTAKKVTPAIPWVGDLADPAEREALLVAARAELGTVNLFVHSASPPRHERDHLFGVDQATWERMRAVNLDAGFHLARELARGMIDQKVAGSMLLLTSLHAITPRNLPHYSTTKAGMAMLVKELAKGLGRYGIRVNALVPGAIAAGGFVASPEMARHIPLGRLGRAEDLAPMALSVLSNRTAGYVTGTSIVVDGGLALKNWFEPPEFGEIV